MNDLSEREFWLLLTGSPTLPDTASFDTDRIRNEIPCVLEIFQCYTDKLNCVKPEVCEVFGSGYWNEKDRKTRDKQFREVTLLLLWFRTVWIREFNVEADSIKAAFADLTTCFGWDEAHCPLWEIEQDRLIRCVRGQPITAPDDRVYDYTPARCVLTLAGEREVLRLLRDDFRWQPIIPELNVSTFIHLLQKQQSSTHAVTNAGRDCRLYELSFDTSKSWSEIAEIVNGEFPGEMLDSESAPKAAKRYCKKHGGQPIPQRKSGKKPGNTPGT